MRGRWFWLAVLAAAIFVGAGAADASHGAKFRIGYHGQFFGAMDVVAWKMGYFDQELGKGNYSMHRFKQGRLMMEAVISNSLDSGHTAGAPYLSGITKGGNFKAIAVNAWMCKTMNIVVPVNSPIKTPADLKGKLIGSLRGLEIYESFLRYVAPKFGIKEKDYTLVKVLSTERLPAMRAGQVDAIFEVEPATTIAIENGWGKSIETFCQYTNPPFVQIAPVKTLSEHPDLYVKYLKAWLRAIKLARTDMDRFMKLYHEEVTSKGAKIGYGTLKTAFSKLELYPRIDDRFYSYIEEANAYFKQVGKAPRVLNYRGGEGVDPRPLERALKEVGGI